MNKSIAIIIPAYNEEKTIKETILSFFRELPESTIIVVNNNSTDNTKQISLETFKNNGIDGILLNEFRQGKANAIRKAFKEVDADIYVMVDADMTYPASKVHELINPIINENIDMCIGDRITKGDYKKENKRAFHNFGNKLVQNLVNKLFNSNIIDIMSGYRSFSKRFVKNYPILVEGFELETDMTLHALDKRFNIREIDISYKDRPDGSESKLDTFNDGFKVLVTIFKIFRYFKPFVFFSFLALFFMLLSLLSGIPVINDWLSYQYIYHVPLAILATGLGLISIILFAVGIILDSISYQNKLEFEQRLIEFETNN
ncbi:glycosyltransferase family 2 protein [Arcobacter arenosus]|uniref:Glycosyltransferase n=1 Tax=Arcobacter arenosus TaxID=2576037 RepID=A0A5R8Y4E1_9BACT|nr:glycosyltransferase family 2 protein [Arcobacter arenosus]TLP39620.1 glycosyltransferase [Arcobacter arenosus]